MWARIGGQGGLLCEGFGFPLEERVACEGR